MIPARDRLRARPGGQAPPGRPALRDVYAQVVVTRPTFRRPPAGAEPVRDPGWRGHTFAYRLPERLADAAFAGQLVQVPLHAGTALGVIASVDLLPPEGLAPESIREVREIVDPLPVTTPLQLELAAWIAGTYLAPLSSALRQVLPPGLEERTYVVVQRRPGPADSLAEEDRQALRLLDRHAGRLKLSALLDRLPPQEGEAAVDRLVDRGLLESRLALIPPRAAPPRVQYASLLADERTVEAALPRLGRASKQADLLLRLALRQDAPPSLEAVCAEAGCTPAVAEALAARGWVRIAAPRTLVLARPAALEGAASLGRAPKQAAAWEALRSRPGPVEVDALRADGAVSAAALRELEKKQLVYRIEEPATLLLALPREQVMDKVLELRGAQTERAVLEALRGSTGRVWVGGLYAQTGADLAVLQRLAERGLVGLHAEASDGPPALLAPAAPALSPEQEAAWDRLRAELGAPRSPQEPAAVLLHGGSGAGKTEIYLRAVEQVLAAGRRALVLVPEVGLAGPLVRRLDARFAQRVAVLHGQLSLGQRYAVWDAVRRGEVDVLVGTRAALFAPLSRLGLIVVDEAHDASFKQEEPIPLPAFHACDVAWELGRLSGAVVVYGTATPGVEMSYRARRGEMRLECLPRRPLPAPARVVDMRQELYAGNRSIFSRALQQALAQALDAGAQAILYLNRRGSATFVLCRDCGAVVRCARCDAPFALHRAGAPLRQAPGTGRPAEPDELVCHRCNNRRPAPVVCPQCGSRRIRPFGLGTERVESELRRLWPAARVLRWDSDAAAGMDPERALRPLLDGDADVLVGTQMVAKGIDLPRVTLVGVISADTLLGLPDFRAAERTFQLLTQVAGRIGVAGPAGQVILQTYQPDQYAIRAAAEHDYEAFYRQELALRRSMGYPPFSRLVALRIQDADPARCRDEAQRLAGWLGREVRRTGEPVDLVGPAPCYYRQIGGRFRWQIVLRGADPAGLLRDVILPAGWRTDVEPVSLL